jgi:membrane-bound ClpP family serine protease
MENEKNTSNTSKNVKTTWARYLLIALVFEKSIQHIFVTIAFYFNWEDIGSTVVVSPKILMILGVIVAVLFILGLWGIITQKKWAINLIIALALFDIIGEFVAQGKIGIMINVSFIVATILLILSLFYRRQEKGM